MLFDRHKRVEPPTYSAKMNHASFGRFVGMSTQVKVEETIRKVVGHSTRSKPQVVPASDT
jgi:hypothetical protein